MAYVYNVAIEDPEEEAEQENSCSIWLTEVEGDEAKDLTCNIKDLAPYAAQEGPCELLNAEEEQTSPETPAEPWAELPVSSEGECRWKCTTGVPQCFALEYDDTDSKCKLFYEETKSGEATEPGPKC